MLKIRIERMPKWLKAFHIWSSQRSRNTRFCFKAPPVRAEVLKSEVQRGVSNPSKSIAFSVSLCSIDYLSRRVTPGMTK